MRPIEQLRGVMEPGEAQRIGIDAMTETQLEALANWGMRIYGLGRERAGDQGAALGGEMVGDIDEVKYDGRLIILTDGSRWEVDPMDASTADMWGPMDKVCIVAGDMYLLSDTERVGVVEDDA